MTDHPQLQLDAQLCFPLYAATRAVTGAYADLLGPVGLTYPQYLTVLALGGADAALTVGDLGRSLRLDSGTLTPLLKRLEAAGHVERQRDPVDERRVLVALTEQGRELRDSLADVPLRMAERMGLGRTDVGELRRLLGALLEGLDDRP
ncbi:MarR family transcriptional regulator [Nocardioides sp.]|uniref:MarR family winged helix-turn-helix transcriptional regulator n=1 Tax=Nocardioides sp. TaxID=35761 RepID=UPI002B68D047|nr:MarR family transcriptional regulator [Nocardioides sp.]HSX68847.1 MarR family transcriptional regulator [Nocardioides sp.]